MTAPVGDSGAPGAERRPDTPRALPGEPEGWVDLAARATGSTVMAASDESFGNKEHLLAPGPADFSPGHYDHRGEVVDGWETRRRRDGGAGDDWVLVRLGTPGVVTEIDVDTSFFTGNHPVDARVEAVALDGYPSPAELQAAGTEWVELVARSPLRGDAHNVFAVTDPRRATHVRLTVRPDGGVARLRVRGTVVPDPRELEGLTVDLAARHLGSRVTACTDGFYSSAGVLNHPAPAPDMGGGWETRRRRDGLHDVVVLRLGLAGTVRRLVVDTTHFRHNATAEIAAFVAEGEVAPPLDDPGWRPLLGWTRLQPDTPHSFPVRDAGPARWMRLDAWPDGGMSRVRLLGPVDPDELAAARARW